MIDIVMLAIVRPKIVERTLTAARKYLFNDDLLESFRLIVEVGAIGEKGCSVVEIESLCKAYFTNVICHMTDELSIPKAYKRGMRKATSDLVFYLEDDYELLRTVNLNAMIQLHRKYADLAILRLPTLPDPDGETRKEGSSRFKFNGEFFECPADKKALKGYQGHPSLIKRNYIRAMLPFIDNKLNPEKQLQQPSTKKHETEVDKWRYGVFQTPNETAAVDHVGADWAAENGFVRTESAREFINYENNF